MDFFRRKDNNESMLGPGLSLHNVYVYFLPKSVFLQTGFLMDSINKIALNPKYLDEVIQIPLVGSVQDRADCCQQQSQ